MAWFLVVETVASRSWRLRGPRGEPPLGAMRGTLSRASGGAVARSGLGPVCGFGAGRGLRACALPALSCTEETGRRLLARVCSMAGLKIIAST